MTTAQHLKGWSLERTGNPDAYGGRYQNLYITAPGGAVCKVFPCGNPRKALSDPALQDMCEGFGGPIQTARANLILAAPQLLEIVRVSIGNVRSLGPAGALGPVYEPYTVWLAHLEAAYAAATKGQR